MAGWNAAGLLAKYTELNLMINRDLPSTKTLRDNRKYLFDQAKKSLEKYYALRREKCE